MNTDTTVQITAGSYNATDSKVLGKATVRVEQLDKLRGLVIILMALDHVRGFFSLVNFNPLNLEQTSFMWFATRWMTHLCAPTFIFLAGMGAALSNKSKNQLGLFLFTRGAWIVFLELTLVSLGWGRYPFAPFIVLQVIWAIGASMMLLAGAIYLPRRLLLFISLAVISCHNLLDPFDQEILSFSGGFWRVLHDPGLFKLGEWKIRAAYPIVPWVALMSLGYLFGQYKALWAQAKNLRYYGFALIVAFFVLRACTNFGSAKPWVIYEDSVAYSVLSFFNVAKYPPSFMFLLITCGISAVLWSLLARVNGVVGGMLRTFGRVPMFFYLVHFPLINLLSNIWGVVRFERDFYWWKGYGHHMGQNLNYDNLGTVYGAWILVLLLSFPLVKWYEGYKFRSKKWWTTYI